MKRHHIWKLAFQINWIYFLTAKDGGDFFVKDLNGRHFLNGAGYRKNNKDKIIEDSYEDSISLCFNVQDLNGRHFETAPGIENMIQQKIGVLKRISNHFGLPSYCQSERRWTAPFLNGTGYQNNDNKNFRDSYKDSKTF